MDCGGGRCGRVLFGGVWGFNLRGDGMEFFEEEEFKPERGGNNGRGNSKRAEIRITIRNQKGKARNVCFMIGELVMKELRWLAGDTVKIVRGKNEAGQDCVKLVRHPAGHTLSAYAKNKGKIVASSLRSCNPKFVESMMPYNDTCVKPIYSEGCPVLVLTKGNNNVK
jgi:hypothetical protein